MILRSMVPHLGGALASCQGMLLANMECTESDVYQPINVKSLVMLVLSSGSSQA